MKEMEIRLDRKRRLRFTYTSFFSMCEMLKISPFELERVDFSNMDNFAIVLFSLLSHEDKNLTLEKAREILNRYLMGGNPQRLLELLEKIKKAALILKEEAERAAKKFL
jgi:hypothetical protein